MMFPEFEGVTVEGYTIDKKIGDGCIGTVYKASRGQFGNRAIKFIRKETLRPNWQNEITKVVQLEQTDGVVRYHSHGNIDINGEEFLYIIWDYIEGDNLRTIIEKKELSLQMLIDVIDTSLRVFYACNIKGIEHSDFHSGNIIIQSLSPLSIEPSRKVYITDFGRGTYSQDPNSVESLDDYKGLARIIQDSLSAINIHELELPERKRYHILRNQFPKFLSEENTMEGGFVRNPKELLQKLYSLFDEENDSKTSTRTISDYMVAETLGDRYEDWEALFVPKFLATDELFDKNICVLTGLRGCGKTTIFRRVSHDLKKRLGDAGIEGENDFVGLYLNARTIAEAFPWLPLNKMEDARKQVISYFNIKWTLIILDWLNDEIKNRTIDISWLTTFMDECFGYNQVQYTSKSKISIVNTLSEYCSRKLRECKLDDAYHRDQKWPLTEYDYLEKLIQQIITNCKFISRKSFYLFLDDYSTPMINEATQKILNPIIFRRSSLLYFKVSTESCESFLPTGLNNKVLEESNDYKLIDLGVKSLIADEKECEDIIDSIFNKRINRSDLFSNKNLSLKKILGDIELSDNKRARQILSSTKNIYYGASVFYKVWSSDIRELIHIFSEMLELTSDGKSQVEYAKEIQDVASCTPELPLIPKDIQDKVFRLSGGNYLNQLNNVITPCEIKPDNISMGNKYGEHLFKIVTALQQIFYSDLQTKTSKNGRSNPPKQARKIEIATGPLNGKLSNEVDCYYKGLIRYGILISDTRGKSIRGSVATRLHLRSLFIPYFNITFSKRDSITLSWDKFELLLREPESFSKSYCSGELENELLCSYGIGIN